MADYEMSLQDNLSVAMNSALDELCGLGYQHAFDVPRRFAAITPEDIQRAAASLLSTRIRIVSLAMSAPAASSASTTVFSVAEPADRATIGTPAKSSTPMALRDAQG